MFPGDLRVQPDRFSCKLEVTSAHGVEQSLPDFCSKCRCGFQVLYIFIFFNFEPLIALPGTV